MLAIAICIILTHIQVNMNINEKMKILFINKTLIGFFTESEYVLFE